MTTKQERETLAALETLGSAAAPRTASKSTGPAVSLRAQGPAEFDASRYFRCLSCGYPLKIRGDTRCSECGATFDAATLSHWFSGAEAHRLDQILWLIRIALGLKLVLLPTVIGYYWESFPSVAWIGSVAAAGWMLWLAIRGRIDERGSRCAIIGMHLVAVLLWMELRVITDNSLLSHSLPSSYAVLDGLIGFLLLISLFQREDVVLPGGRSIVRNSWVALLVLPPLAFVASRVLTYGGLLSVDTLASSLIDSFLGPFVISLVWFLLNLAIWAYVWWRIFRLRKALFEGRKATAFQ